MCSSQSLLDNLAWGGPRTSRTPPKAPRGSVQAGALRTRGP